MASKQGKLQQRNKQANSKLLAPPSQEPSSDPWSFLERIDAPQWVDLSLEASLMGREGFDSWFERSHKHHVMSLAGLNTNMSWWRLGKSKGPIPSRNNSKGCQKEVNKPEKKQSAGHLNKSGNGQSQSQSQVTALRVHKGAQYSNNIERGSNAPGLYGSVETGCTLSGCSSTSDCKPSGSFKKRSLCSDRSSVSSSLQACSVELNKLSKVQRGSSNVNLSEDSYDTPTSCIGGVQRSRNSSSASYCPPMVKSRYSSEVGVSTCTKVRYSSELGVSTVRKQFVCEADRRSSGDSAVTSVSGVSHTSEEQVGKGCARIWEEGTFVSEVDDDVDYNQPLTRGFIADSSTVNKSSLHCQHMSNEVVKSGMKAGRQRLDTRVFQVGSLPRKQLYAGKENATAGNLLQVKDKSFHIKAPLAIASSKTANAKSVGLSLGGKENATAGNLLQVKDKSFYIKAPVAMASSKTANAKSVGPSLGGGFHASQVSKKEGLRCATQVVTWKSGVSPNLNSGRASSVAHLRKRSEAKQLPVACEKTSESERDLAALVAQHNQKIRSLGLQSCRKGLR